MAWLGGEQLQITKDEIGNQTTGGSEQVSVLQIVKLGCVQCVVVLVF